MVAKVIKDFSWMDKCEYHDWTAHDHALDQYLNVSHLAVDIETTGLSPLVNKLVGISMSCQEGEGSYLDVRGGGLKAVQELRKFEECWDGTFLFYNAKFELAWFDKYGWRPKKWLDVRVLLYNAYLSEAKDIKSLKSAAKHILGIDMITLKELFKANNMTLKNHDFASLPVDETTVKYACADADITYRLFEQVRTMDKSILDSPVVALDHKLYSPIMAMEAQGVLLDTKEVERISNDVQSTIMSTETNIIAWVKKKFPETSGLYNPRSGQQTAHILFKMLGLPILKTTDGGAPSTDTATLKRLNKTHKKKVPLLQDILTLREVGTREKTYLKSLRTGVCPLDGRIHVQYDTCRQATGRLSSTGDGQWLKTLNFQGIPNLPDDHPHNIRRAFLPSEGYKWFSVDMANIEIRIIANGSRDKALVDALLAGQDLHEVTCKKLFGKTRDDVDFAKWRKIAKVCLFNLAYAFGTTALRAKIEDVTEKPMSKKMCKEIYELFYNEAYPAWGAYRAYLVQEARKTYSATTLFGRTRDLTSFYSNGGQFFGCAGDRQAVNHPIQGTCSDLLRKALIEIHDKYQGDSRVNLLLSVHDELNFEVDVTNISVDESNSIMLDLMNIISWTPDDWVVPVTVSCGLGKNWAEAK